jgi:hypothetical protein
MGSVTLNKGPRCLYITGHTKGPSRVYARGTIQKIYINTQLVYIYSLAHINIFDSSPMEMVSSNDLVPSDASRASPRLSFLDIRIVCLPIYAEWHINCQNLDCKSETSMVGSQIHMAITFRVNKILDSIG